MGIGQVKAVFLDRDGVINANVYHAVTKEWESPLMVGELQILPGVFDALRKLVHARYSLFLVSNQPAYAKGKTTLEKLQTIHEKLHASFAKEGIKFTDYFYCYHYPEGTQPGHSGPCVCRKPSPFFLREAARRHGLDLGVSWMVGDREADILCGSAAGTRTILIHDLHAGVRKLEAKPDFEADNLSEAAGIILKGG